MTATLMRTSVAKGLSRAQLLRSKSKSLTAAPYALVGGQPKRSLASVRETRDRSSDVRFSPSIPHPLFPNLGPGSGGDHKPPNERTVKLGKTIRILHERLPTLLVSPLPQEILSPQVTLRLFPSTHPHLPRVSGKLAYVAALWTSPVAWGRLPILGNVKLQILSERMIRNGRSPDSNQSTGSEKLVVRWKTCGKETESKVSQILSRDRGEDDKEFVGLFIFEFDEEGRLVTHTIEHVEEGGNWERKTARVISVTDWLLGKAWGKKEEEVPGLAVGYCEVDHADHHHRGSK